MTANLMVFATFRFYEELNDFLPMSRRKCDISLNCAENATTKHMIEALGVPHTEVELVLLNGESVGLDVLLREGDRVAVYPKFERFDVSSLLRIRENTQRTLRFVADAHLGGLARLLRMAGFDTLYDNHIDDAEVAAHSERDGRIVLTRDRDLLKRRAVTHGCYIRNIKAEKQLVELVDRLDMAASSRPFSLCLRCNAPMREVDKAVVWDRLPEKVREMHEYFQTCDVCQGVFWRGTHWQRMVRVLEAAGIKP